MPTGSLVIMALGVAALACGLPMVASAGPATAFPFPTTKTQLWLSPDDGHVSGAPGSVLLLKPQPPTSGETANNPMIPILGQVGLSNDEATWYGGTSWDASREVVGSIAVELFFFVNVPVTTRLAVEVYDVAPDGTQALLGQATRQASLQNILPYSEIYLLDSTGAVLGKGHSVRLLVTADGVDVVTWLQYGSTEAPANIVIPHRVLDSDRDGIPDDVDPCVTEADCNNDGVIDGDTQTSFDNSTSGTPQTFYQYYYDWAGEPGGPGGPGGPGDPDDRPGVPELPDQRTTAPLQLPRIELVVGAALGVASMLVALGGLFVRHPL